MPTTLTTSSMIPVSVSTWKPHTTSKRPARIQLKASQLNGSSWWRKTHSKAYTDSTADVVTIATGMRCACLPMRLPTNSVTTKPRSGSSTMSATAIFM